MTDIAIKVENLTKRYRIGAREEIPDSLAGAVVGAVSRPIKNFKRLRRLSAFADDDRHRKDVIWALNDVSFEVDKGEVVGIIGVNGSGKSTLLKILSRITQPTSGRATTRGRTASLLEVGTGFHKELTGRENAYLNGTLLGMRRREIDEKFSDIVEFAGVEKFIDTPVKRYSNGMVIRLAFAVAAHLEPETLIVDEVLAVGDVGFQEKCMAKMGNIARSGTTVLFVSHQMASVSTLCERVILLNKGNIEAMGAPRDTINTYLKGFSQGPNLHQEWDFEEATSKGNVKIKEVTVTDGEGTQNPYLPTTEPIYVTIDYWVTSVDRIVSVGIWLIDPMGNPICSVGNLEEVTATPPKKTGLYRAICTIPPKLLNGGRHTLTIGGYSDFPRPQLVAVLPRIISFDTVDDYQTDYSYPNWPGVIKPKFAWETVLVDHAG